MNSDTSSIRILIVDDHPALREGVVAILADQNDMSVVAQASNGREAIQQFRANLPDVVLMDLQMPEMNGLDAITTIRGEFPDARVIVLTTYTGDVQVLRALRAGARAYLIKNLLHKDLLETIRARGNANKQIAAQLSITEETVKGRVKNILSKLGANDRTHAAMIGLKRGIIES
jgi:DNA-binding NarL/FixJ family response regulator